LAFRPHVKTAHRAASFMKYYVVISDLFNNITLCFRRHRGKAVKVKQTKLSMFFLTVCFNESTFPWLVSSIHASRPCNIDARRRKNSVVLMVLLHTYNSQSFWVNQNGSRNRSLQENKGTIFTGCQ